MTKSRLPSTRASLVTREATGCGETVITRLVKLQNSHRLAIHMVECSVPMFKVHRKTLRELSAVPASDICHTLKNGKASLFSMSLLPSTQSGVAIRPYAVRSDQPNTYGYLFDLSQTSDHAAKVTRANHGGLSSDHRGRQPTRKHKHYKLFREKSLPDLKRFYAKHEQKHETTWEKAIEAEIGGPNGAKHTEFQLDTLGKAYETRNSVLESIRIDDDPSLLNYNELFVAASPEHIAAVVVPYYPRVGRLTPNTQRNLKEAKDFVHLQAAIIGLDHLAHGHSLPVVLYHVYGENKGTIEYVGQEKDVLLRVALDALRELGSSGHMAIAKRLREYTTYPEYTSLIEMVRTHIGIDVSPNNLNWPQEVTLRLVAGPTPPPASSPPPRRTSSGSGGRC